MTDGWITDTCGSKRLLIDGQIHSRRKTGGQIRQRGECESLSHSVVSDSL